MNYYECDQRSDLWWTLRAGSCTGSVFGTAVDRTGGLTEQQLTYAKAVKSGKSDKEACQIAGYQKSPTAKVIDLWLEGKPVDKPSDPSEALAAKLAIERIYGQQYEEERFETWQAKRGQELEALARQHYEQRYREVIYESGIYKTDDDFFGVSLDGRFTGGEQNAEIKCPVKATKIVNLWSGGEAREKELREWQHQIQGGMWVTGAKSTKLIVYTPALEPIERDLLVLNIPRDDDFIEKMEAGLNEFRERVLTIERRLRAVAAVTA